MNISRIELFLITYSFNTDFFHNDSYVEYLLNNNNKKPSNVT